MAYVQIGDRQHPLVAGENEIGSVEGARIPLPVGPNGVRDLSAAILVEADGSCVIRRVGDLDVVVNGVQLGAEPTPLIHGDKIDVGPAELFFGDDRKGGNTRFVTAVKRPEAASTPETPKRLWSFTDRGTGGRLVSLVDGREYAVPDSGLVVGRDPTCDVVVPTGEVSRKHAVISAAAGGYMVTDTSANGLSVNGQRVASSCLLVRGDVLKVGPEEFRFHTDVVPARPVLATLEVNSSGLLNGTMFELRSHLTHIGRGEHNEIVLSDDSISDSHAKLQLRDDGWYVVDMGSTNGTYVGGRRILGEALLEGAPDLRVGGIKFIFRPTDAATGVAAESGAASGGGLGTSGGVDITDVDTRVGGGQTRAIAALTPEQRARLMASARAGAAAEGGAGSVGGESGKAQDREPGVVGERGSRDRRRGPSLLFWTVVIAAVAIAVFLLFF